MLNNEVEEEDEVSQVESLIVDEKIYCRKCMKQKPSASFYDACDNGLVDSNGKFSICKDCVNNLYDKLYVETGSFEKTLHKMCTSLNIKFSNEAVTATKKHILTIQESGKNVKSPFGIFKAKLFALQKSMDKSASEDMGYTDYGAIYTSEIINLKETPIPDDVLSFWGKDLAGEDIEFLEHEYANFKQTHSTSSYAEITLLKEVCNTMLTIKKLRKVGDDTKKEVRELQDLMKNLAISPNNLVTSSGEKGVEAIGMWIKDIENFEPAQWLKNNPQYDMFRDVPDVEKYFQDYFVRPLKNAMGISKDFNIDDTSEVEGGISDDEGLNIFNGEE